MPLVRPFLLVAAATVLGLPWLLVQGPSLRAEERAVSTEAPAPRTLVVSHDGSGQYTSIQQAVDEARRGDTVVIKAGEYHEDVTIHSKDRLTLQGEGAGRVTILGLNRVGTFHIGKWPYGATHVEISGVTIHEHGGLALGMFNGRSIVLRDVWIKGMVFGQQVKDVRIENSRIGNSETTGVQFADSEAVLTGNIIHDNDHGVTVAGQSDVRIERNVITRNLFEAVLVTDSAKAVVVSNTIAKNGGGIAFLQTSRGEASGNVISLNTVGFVVAPSSRPVLSYNAVHNSQANYSRPGLSPPTPALDLKPETDLAVEPSFVDSTRDDFRLRPGSALVGVGKFAYLGALPPVESLQ
ncbi:pectinesterase family protein [Candidatus Nitrospira bockiana]